MALLRLHGIGFEVRYSPALEPDFMPILKFNRAYLEKASVPLGIALMRPDGQTFCYETKLRGTPESSEADRFYVDRLVKSLLWMKGGSRLLVRGSEEICESLKAAYAENGSRAFDANFMAGIYGQPFEVVSCENLPEEKLVSLPVGGHFDGCRIGFDAGGSDRKVSAVIDGRPVYSEEIVWNPKENPDPDYHFRGIVAALKTAAFKMPRVDAVGISSAGVFIGNRTVFASLFRSVPKALFESKVRDIYPRAVKEIGDMPVTVCNDGDVSALAGAMNLGRNNLLAVTMGTSEAGGYIDASGGLTGWLNELATMPVDLNPQNGPDGRSGDVGCGSRYFSQETVIRLAPAVGIRFRGSLSPAEKLREVQCLLAEGHTGAKRIYESIGAFLGHSLAYYYDLYGCGTILLMGRVVSGMGGEIALKKANEVLAGEYPETAERLSVILPDETSRRVGQSVAAASL
ncbi:MAG TPA: ROK family protein [Oscillospiraceae bacterium]|nr:ROK family protein [Oscillospiraceae bacterium]